VGGFGIKGGLKFDPKLTEPIPKTNRDYSSLAYIEGSRTNLAVERNTMPTPAQITHTVHLLPQDTTLDELDHIATLLHPDRTTFTYSADAAHAIVHHGRPDSAVIVWGAERWHDDLFAWLHDRGVATHARNMDGSEVAGHVSHPAANKVAPAQIEHSIHLLPQDTTQPEIKQVVTALHPNRTAFTYSADAVHALIFSGTPGSSVVVWSAERWHDNIFAWLHDHAINNITANRLAGASNPTFVFTNWPTDDQMFTQGFNANPLDYKPFGLTGHEGVDIKASIGSNVYAVADGEVYQIRQVDEGHNYGNAVYIRHGDGYRTAYAHLKEILVNTTDKRSVTGGQLIGKADSTGNVRPKDNPVQASHLHLTLYHDGATARHETPQPRDIINPEPFLKPLRDGWKVPIGAEVLGWLTADSLDVNVTLGRVRATSAILRTGAGDDQPRLGSVRPGTVLRLAGASANGYWPVSVVETAVTRDQVRAEIGVHNGDGAQWMLDQHLTGWAVTLTEIGTVAQPLDMQRFAQAGIKILVRLNYHYGTSGGNIPREDHPDYEPFMAACVSTINNSQGVWGFILGNETNNPKEFPDNQAATPEQYARLYNRIWHQVPAAIRVGVQAVDPYYGPGSDSRDYWLRILNNIDDTNFLTVHPKTQDSLPDNVDSDAKFSDDPLRWQYFHLRAYQPLLEVVPDRFRNLPVIATEVNPQLNDRGKLGWQSQRGAEWVRRAMAHFTAYNARASLPISGIVFYRFSEDEWEISGNPSILDAIKAAA
jgi:hypothetical protein